MRTPPPLAWAVALSVGLHAVVVGRLPAWPWSASGEEASSLWTPNRPARSGIGATAHQNSDEERLVSAAGAETSVPVDLVTSEPSAPAEETQDRSSRQESATEPPESDRILRRADGRDHHRPRPEGNASQKKGQRRSNSGAYATENGNPTTGSEGGSGDGDGEAGRSPPVRGMTLPLLRVLPIALSANPSLSNLPVGRVGTVELEFTATEAGRARLERPLPTGVKPEFRALVDQMLKLLEWPRYAVRSAELVEGTERVRLTMTVTQDTASAELLASSGGAYGLGADPPNGHRPGKAHCTWANGHRIDVTLERLDR